ncbi:4-(cytidine 5'-diphospho)-2-C-methyl-D-erythritol kinase [Cytophagaceae bacterium ABcell3]|nr:4-(cytidine 5'-diphospho)-2-C-methyl-D-erythritol kinase [Cytophagaceae bacterium ABcell3]
MTFRYFSDKFTTYNNVIFPMITFPNAKINVGLFVTEKRPDGFHNLETCFYPIPLHDTLEILLAPTFKFSTSGIPVEGPETQNLCVKAYQLLNEAYSLPPVHIHLHKVIPMGAGLGGGSSDAAFTIKLLNDIFDLNLTTAKMEEFAGKLGSDCPFFIRNKPVLATGKGTAFAPTTFSLHGKFLLLVYPDVHISTAQAYAAVKPAPPKIKLEQLLAPTPNWIEIVNDFEQSVLSSNPRLAQLKDTLIETNPIYASMSGSGSTFYAIYNEKPQNVPQFPDNYYSEIMQLS